MGGQALKSGRPRNLRHPEIVEELMVVYQCELDDPSESVPKLIELCRVAGARPLPAVEQRERVIDIVQLAVRRVRDPARRPALDAMFGEGTLQEREAAAIRAYLAAQPADSRGTKRDAYSDPRNWRRYTVYRVLEPVADELDRLRPASPGDGPRRRPWRLAVAVVAMLLVFAGLMIVTRDSGPRARLLMPAAGAVVGSSLKVSGTASGLGAGRELWIAVRPTILTRLYPQRGALVVRSDGHWEVEVSLGDGTSGTAGESFVLMVLLVDRKTGDEFRRRLAAGDNRGFEPLPVGAEQLADREVRLRSL